MADSIYHKKMQNNSLEKVLSLEVGDVDLFALLLWLSKCRFHPLPIQPAPDLVVPGRNILLK